MVVYDYLFFTQTHALTGPFMTCCMNFQSCHFCDMAICHTMKHVAHCLACLFIHSLTQAFRFNNIKGYIYIYKSIFYNIFFSINIIISHFLIYFICNINLFFSFINFINNCIYKSIIN